MTAGVTAIVLNYRRPLETVRCVDSLKKSSAGSPRIIVVDNHSGDDSESRVRAAHPDVEVRPSGSNQGYTGGMNAGIARALETGAEYILLVNSDTEADPEFVGRLLEALRSNPRAAAATGTIRHAGAADAGRLWYAGGYLRPWRASAFTRHRFREVPGPAAAAVRRVTFISGCAFLVRSEVIRKLGPFDNRFFMYVEDAEFSSRLLGAGYELLYVPAAMIDHHAGREVLTPALLYYSVRNRFLFLELATRGPERALGRLYLSLASIFKACVWCLSSWALVRAAWMGFRDYRSGNFYAGSGPLLDGAGRPGAAAGRGGGAR